MDDPLLVRLFKRLSDLACHGQALIKQKRPAQEPLRQRLTLDQFHHQGPDAVRLFEAEDRGDVRVMELGQDLRFALESSKPFGVFGIRRGKDLDGHLPVELGVGGAIHLAHAAFAELGGDLVGAEASADG